MVIDVSSLITDFNGDSLKLRDDEDTIAIDLRMVIDKALLESTDSEGGIDAYTRYEIVKKMHKNNNDKVSFTVEELAIIKSYIPKFWKPMIVGRAFDLLENN